MTLSRVKIDSSAIPVFRVEALSVYYNSVQFIDSIDLNVAPRTITALIGPSGCGKSTILRCFNRLNDLVPGCQVRGNLYFFNDNIYGENVNTVHLRRRVGMVLQKPTPLPGSIFNNVAFGARLNGYKGSLSCLVESALKKVGLWEDVKDKLKKSAEALSGGQQQRMCIARAIAIEPEVLLMDEPCSSLDPISTSKIEELIKELSIDYSLVIVTHNMQQARRISDYTAFLNIKSVEESGVQQKVAYLAELGTTEQIFTSPRNKATLDYVSGAFG
jgi:phosphate transport system ATP-binding protein